MSQPSREQSSGALSALRGARVQKRVLVPALLLVLALALYFAPQLPAVRGWALSRAQNVVSDLGYDLSYARSAGNLWRGVTLRGAEVTGPGVNARLERLSLEYNLLGLLAGRLPFSVSVADVSGDIEPQEVRVPQGNGSSGNRPIRPVLRSADVNGVNLNVNDVPYTLPDLNVADLSVNDTEDGLGVATTLTTPQGEAQVDADVAFSPLNIDARLPRVDLAVAKHWFEGVEGGQASGTVTYADGEAKADLALAQGAVTVAGTTITELSGPVNFDGQTVTADLTGRALGGDVQGDAVVDISAQRWQAEVTGDAKLAEAAAWLARGDVPEGAVTGDADVSLSLSGWQQIDLTGQAQGQGEVFGRALEDLDVDFGFETEVGTRVQANGALAGGPFTASVTPLEGGGVGIQAQAEGVNVTEQFRADLRADLQQSEGLSGDARLALSGSAAGRALSLNADAAALADGGWIVDLSGGDDLGAALSGEVALRGEQLTGELRAQGVSLEGTPVQAEPLNATLSADGTLSELPVTLRLGTQNALTPSVAGVELASDLSGAARAVLDGTTLRDLSAQFGPLSANGSFDLADQTGRLEYALDSLDLGGRVQGSLSLQGGVLERNEDALTSQVTVDAADLAAFGVAPFDLNADVSLENAQALTGTVDGVLAFAEDATLDVSGTFRDLLVTGTVPADLLLASDAVALNGDVRLDAQANLLEPSYDVETVWGTAEQSLELNAQGRGGQSEGTLSAEGLRSAFSTRGGFNLEADGFTLSPFLTQPDINATLNGSLGYAGGWNGALNAQVDAPVDAAVELVGAGDALRLDAQTAQGALDASVSGQVLPAPNLEVDASAAERAQLSGTLRGTSLNSASFDGTLQTQAVETPQASVNAQTAQVQASLSGGLSAQLNGENIDLNLNGGTWAGNVDLPFTLRGEAHTLQANLTGETASPQLDGNVRGPLVQGPVSASRQGGQASLNVDAAPFLPTEDAQLNADLSFSQDLSWNADVTGDGTYRGAPIGVQATVSGERQNYGGEGALRLRDGRVPFQVSGAGADVEASTQLEDFDLANVQGLVPGSPTGTASGTAQFSRTDEGLSYGADLNAAGTAQGRPLDVRVRAGDETGVDITGEVAGTRIALDNAASGEANTYDVSLDEGPLTLQAQVRAGERVRVTGDGTFQGEPLSVAGSLEPATLTGDLNATLGDATLSVDATAQQIQGELNAPNGVANVAQPLSADFRATRENGQFALTSLSAALPQRNLALSLAGPAWPNPDLTGSLQTGVLDEPVEIGFRREDGYLLLLEPGELTLLADLSPGFALESLRAEGALEVFGTNLVSDLAWRTGSGFSGEAQAVFAQGEANASVTLAGRGNLEVSGLMGYGGEEVATLQAALSRAPWRDGSVSGSVNVAAPVSDLSAAYPGEPLAFVGDLTLGGTLSQPNLAGPVTLEGALEAAGALRASREGASFILQNDALDVGAQATPQGWTLSLDADALLVQDLLPPLDAPRLTAQLQGAGTWGGAPDIRADTLLLESVRSRVAGELRYDGALYAPLDVSVDLAELGSARGELEGALLIGSADAPAGTPLSGTLAVRNVGLAESPWSLGGDLDLGGTLGAPTLETRLVGTGSAEGGLTARLEPGRYAALTSTLALGALNSDLRLRWRLGELAAEGQVAFADYALALDAADDTILLAGNEKLAGWRGALSTSEAQLTGDLASLSPQLGGALDLAAAWGSEVSVAGTFTGLQAGPLALGDLALSSEGEGDLERLTLQGDILTASVDLTDAVTWQARLELPLPSDSALAAEGGGTLSEGALDAVLSSTLAGDALQVPLAVRYGDDGLRVASQADLLSGTLDLDARYGVTDEVSGWSGRLELSDVTLRGAEADVQATLSGALAEPSLDGTLTLERDANALAGTFALSPGRLALEQRLVSPFLEEPLALTGTALPLKLSLSTSPQNQLTVTRAEGTLAASGALALGAGPASVRLTPSEVAGGWLDLALSAPQTPGLALSGTLPSGPPQVWAGELLRGFTLAGVQDTQGSVTLQAQPTPRAEVSELRWGTALGTLELAGTAVPGDVDLQGTWRGAEDATLEETTFLPWLAEVRALPFELDVADSRAEVSAAGDVGTLDASVDWAARTAALDADLALGTGAATSEADEDASTVQAAGELSAALRYTPETGPTGDIRLLEVPLADAPDLPALTLTTLLTADPRGLRGSGALGVGAGQATVQGQLGWAQFIPQGLRETYLPQANRARVARLRLDGVNVSELPLLQRRVPNLDAPLSGVVRLNGNQVVGQLVSPGLSVAQTTLPTQVELSGTVQNLEARASLGDSQLRVGYDGEGVSGFFDLEQFPLEILAEAATGASTVNASATGAARFDVPLNAPAQSYVQVATERLTLRREGSDQVTRGEVALRYDEGGLIIDRAEFRGGGFWRASGRVTRDVLDLSLQAEDADVTPLLSLAPRLAALGVGAQGSLSLAATGTLGEPQLELTSPNLQLRLAGSTYRLTGTRVTLNDEDLDIVAAAEGVAPIGGSLALRGGGRLSLAPYSLEDFALDFEGNAALPVVGPVRRIAGEVTAGSGDGWRLDSRASLGQPVTLTGSLAPLNLALRGENLNLNAQNFFVASSATDAAFDITRRGENFVISGDAVVESARLTTARNRSGSSDTSEGAGAASSDATPSGANTSQTGTGRTSEAGAPFVPDAEPGAASGDAPAPTPSPTSQLGAFGSSGQSGAGAPFGAGSSASTTAAPNPVLQRILFEDVDILAQSSVLFRAGFGTAELTFDLDLSGTAADPALSGVARTLQGTVRFSGKDFVIEEGTATFEPSQGVFPVLDLVAQATFDKDDALGNLRNTYTFVEPREGRTFGVQLSVDGSFEEVAGRSRPVLDLEPSLSSDAAIQEQGGNAPRPLDEPELVSLLTLGRLQLGTGLAGADSLAGTIAEGAIDTAVDFLVLSELQSALGDALGVGLFEIRTSAVSSLLAGSQEDPFGVSLRVGGYIGDDLFASLEVGRFDDPEGRYALSNEFSLRYDLAPLELLLAGEVNFLNDASAVTEFDFSLGYAVTPLISLEAGLGASGLNQSARARFGVSFTW